MSTTNLLVGNGISGIGFSKDRVVVMEMNELDNDIEWNESFWENASSVLQVSGILESLLLHHFFCRKTSTSTIFQHPLKNYVATNPQTNQFF